MYIYNNAPSEEDEQVIRYEIAEVELFRTKLDAYHAATQPNNNGSAALSETFAKSAILGMSEKEIVDDLLNQFLESKVRAEIANAAYLLLTSGLFDDMVEDQSEDVKTLQDEHEGKTLQIELLKKELNETKATLTEFILEVSKIISEQTKAVTAMEVTMKLIREAFFSGLRK
jgi:hypothetical protein